MPKQIAASPALDPESSKPTDKDSFLFACDDSMPRMMASASNLWRFKYQFNDERIKIILGMLSHNPLRRIPKNGGRFHA